jgi:RNA polymerase sigma factor (sigma-70 family)
MPDKTTTLTEFARDRHSTACGWARRYLKGGTLAEDAVQDALVIATRKLDMYDDSRPFEPWMKSVIERVCLQKLRQFRRRAPALLIEDLGGFDAPDTEDPIAVYLDIMDRGVTVGRLMTAFRSLSPLDRDLVLDIYMNDVTIEDASEGLGCKTDVLRQKLARIVKAVVRLMETGPVPI